VTCASLALADAGVELYDMVAGCNVIMQDGAVVLDPHQSSCSSSDCTSAVTVAFMPSLQQVTHFEQTGNVAQKDIARMLDAAITGSRTIARLMRSCLKQQLLE
jgi:exosome complex component MTR3